MSDRICNKCGEAKPLTSEFYSPTNGSAKTFRKTCKLCRNSRCKEYYEETRPIRIDTKRRFYRSNKEKFFAYALNRRSYIKTATPNWDSELTSFVFEEAFHLARLREEAHGIRYAVDHDIPLRGRNVSGLHVWNNFKVIPYEENQRKLNKYVI